jgi:hypothetical protein
MRRLYNELLNYYKFTLISTIITERNFIKSDVLNYPALRKILQSLIYNADTPPSVCELRMLLCSCTTRSLQKMS